MSKHHHTHKRVHQKEHFKQFVILIFAFVLWFVPPPEGLDLKAWHLFDIFISTIIAVVIEAVPIFTASIIALSVSVLLGILKTGEAYSGFSKGFILLIVVAFLIARGVIKSGLGKRIAFLIIKKFGKSSLGLSYSLIAADIFIAPAFPSNTARSGVLFPIVNALAHDSHSKVADGTRKKLGAFLMMSSMAGITLSSSLWLTAMAANPTGVAIAKSFGVNISYLDWVLGALVPVIVLFFLVPYIIYKIYPPQIKYTPDASKIAQTELEKMGKFSKNEYIMSMVFILMLVLWVFSSTLGVDKTAVAFLGLGILMATNIFSLEDLKHEGGALETFIWFATLYTISVYLNKFGFMGYLGTHIAQMVVGYDWYSVYLILVLGYIFIHYFFVSQTAHMLALYGIFLSVGINASVEPVLLALMLLYATNFNAIITPQGSSANVIYIGSGYITPMEVYKVGGIVTLINSLVFLTLGSLSIMLILK
jgi:DASS family divalent anion:Na+ symporter